MNDNIELIKLNHDLRALINTKSKYLTILSISRDLSFRFYSLDRKEIWENTLQTGRLYVCEGGNSYSTIKYENDKLQLEFEVSGGGGDCQILFSDKVNESNIKKIAKVFVDILSK